MSIAEKVPPAIIKGKRGGARPNSGGARPGAGRRKGIPNKLTRDVKEAILVAFQGVGGATYLQGIAATNPTAFCTLLGKVLPMTIAGDPENPVKTITRIELVAPGFDDSED